MINRATFYETIRHSLFGGHLTTEQVQGIDTILDEWEERELTDLRWLSYMLATTYHETGIIKDHVLIRTMQPVTEFGSEHYLRSKKYYPYIGRGFVQLTWAHNYIKFGKILDIDLYNHPERALQPIVATQIMFEGMIRGLFTGVSLGRYFNAEREDWVNARKIINGLDRAEDVAEYGEKFYEALLNSFIV